MVAAAACRRAAGRVPVDGAYLPGRALFQQFSADLDRRRCGARDPSESADWSARAGDCVGVRRTDHRLFGADDDWLGGAGVELRPFWRQLAAALGDDLGFAGSQRCRAAGALGALDGGITQPLAIAECARL